ncbi:dsDNA nuclease domain-containing protein [Caballeronia sp. LZ062]|uniref:dsDNA nuclease domain-containing protein n=1 Tax=unclassified Caballeronia TaxID=2646786 RepID=UPI00285E7F44|nr:MULTISPECIES: dsDNA nuclease domain-containing protein [unclassified Caballeronia]MDR5855777.1 dsDNA nuclease domain-containing protein [Caballeronia sp. LZ050]MDR5872436.1 dsDNA nuclease domain-containing protein [Caballeronia sp. LZ062]
MYAPQRETAGAVTADRFSYQYDWALHEFLELHHRGEASIVFVELHEDVVFGTSLDADAASFIFCQVKAGGRSGFSTKALVKRTDGKNSILGKIFSSVEAKEIAKRVHKLGLIAARGFSLNLKTSGFSLEEIPFGELEEKTAEDIRAALKAELNSEAPLEKLHFREPSLDIRSPRRAVIGLISDLLTERNPSQLSNSTQIYVVLTDELRRKGAIAWDYSDWDQLVARKGLTADRVEALFAQYSSTASTDELISDFDLQARELGFVTRDVKRLRERARTYLLNTLAGGALVQVQVRNSIVEHLASLDGALCRSTLDLLVGRCASIVSEHLREEESRVAAYIIEYLRSS